MWNPVKPSSSVILLCVLATQLAVSALAQRATSGAGASTQSDPPFSGTIFIDPDIIVPSDPSTYQSMVFSGQAARTMFDRRVNNWITANAFLFDATFDDGLTVEVQVNPEFSNASAAQTEAEKYARVIGQLPNALRTDVQTVWIHKGTEPFGGGNNNLLIHVGQAVAYTNDGILEETLVHEAAHTSLDAAHAGASGWVAAQSADAEFILSYARDFPNREDIAESFLPWVAVRYRAARISSALEQTITRTMPNRMSYFDNLALNMHPILASTTSVPGNGRPGAPVTFVLQANYPNPFNPTTTISYSIPKASYVELAVYDVQGIEIQTLVSEFQSAASYSVKFDARDLPSGIYFYRLTAGQQDVKMRKMAYVR